MDSNTPVPATPPPTDGLIMPEVPQVTAEPTAIPVTTPDPVPVVAPAVTSVPVAPVAEPVPVPEPVADVAPVAEPVPIAVTEDRPKPNLTPVEPVPEPIAAPAPAPVPEPAPAPIPEPENDPLFAPVTEEDPLEVVPEPVAPTPTAPVTDQAMQQLDDGPHPVIASTGQAVVATSEPHKSRRKTMLMLVVGILLLAGIGFGVYTYFMKPNVSETATPSAIVAVDQLSPENLKQATDAADLTAGSQTNGDVIILSGEAPSGSPEGLSLEVEIQPLGTDFTGTPTESSIAVADETDPLKRTLTDYPAGSYHWQGRLSDGTTQGPWTTFNTNEDAGKTADFTIDRTAPAAALIKTLNGRKVSAKTISSTVAKPVFTGTGEAGVAITVAFGTTVSYKAAVAADGTWTLTTSAAVPNARYPLTITSTDPAGNATATSYTLTQAAR